MNISFIGYGKIAQALATGFLQSKQHRIQASAPSLARGINAQGVETTPDNLSVLAGANVIILAVKPAQMAKVIAEISSSLTSDCLLISVATGLTLAWFTEHTSPKIAVIRAMPNISASVRQSATPLIANEIINEQQQQVAESLFNSIGISTWIHQESDIDTFTALSGSGPAYVFQFMQYMVDAAVSMGLEEHVARAFTLETVSGAVALATKSKKCLRQLTDEVTSKGGTTAAALDVFKSNHVAESIAEAMIAARDRAVYFAQKIVS